MNTRQFGHFLSVLENRSILRAAHQLNISQPALSKSISKLEEAYGTRLFDRLPRGVRPTAFALTLERHARRILADVERSRATAGEIASGAQGTVHVGTGPAFVPVVSAAVRDMLAEHPNVDFSLVEGHNAALRASLLVNSIDVFIAMISGHEDAKEFRVRHLVTDKIVCVCRKGHPLLGHSLTADDLVGFSWILPETGEIGRTMLEAYFRARELPPLHVQITTNSDRMVRSFLKNSDLIGILPEAFVERFEHDYICAIPLPDLTMSRKVGVVKRREQDFSESVEIFERFLERRLVSLPHE
jgi:DNA-binding transcriptional LysR family regulator